ncbi:MAG: sorbosone dehydrogenase family protein [Actinomycetota bacterium]
MTRRALLAPAVSILLLTAPAAVGAQEGAPGPRIVVDGLEFPAGIAFDSRGRMFVNERAGRVRIVRNGRLDPEPLAQIPTTTSGETGLLGIAVSPDDRFAYVFATEPDGASNRVLRVPTGGGDVETIIDGLPASVYHNGGGVAFDQDGMLLVSNGEQHDDDRAQDPHVLGGKVYRFTDDGGAVEGDPFEGSDALAIGLRNPYGLAVDPVSGAPFVTENGPSSFDEVNRIVPGGNYGWPVVSGPAEAGAADGLRGSYQDPLLAYPDIVVPTGIAFADPVNARGSVAGDLFFATYGEQAIHRVTLDEARSSATSDEIYLRSDEPVIALAWGPDGLYYSTPGAVALLPLARARRDRDAPQATPTPEPQARPPADDAPSQKSSGTNLALVGAAVAAIVALGLAVALGAARRKRDPPSDAM